MITIYNGSGSVYQTILPTENDITYDDLIKYIKIPKHPEFDEIDFNYEIDYTVFVETSIILFDNCESGCNKIKLDDEINKNELFVMFNYKYYLFSDFYGYYEFINDIKDYDNIFDAIRSNFYNIIFIDPQIENYNEICKFIVQRNGYLLRYVKKQTEEICKLAVQDVPEVLKYAKKQTEEICKRAVWRCGCLLKYVKDQTEEICKLAIMSDCYALEYVKVQTEEMCKLAVQTNGCALEFVKEQTEEICQLAVQNNSFALTKIKDITMRKKFCK